MIEYQNLHKVRLISKYKDNFDTKWQHGISILVTVKISTLPAEGSRRIVLLTDKKVSKRKPENHRHKVFSLDVIQSKNFALIAAAFEIGNVTLSICLRDEYTSLQGPLGITSSLRISTMHGLIGSRQKM